MAVLDILIGRSDMEPYAQMSILITEEKQLHPFILAAQNNDLKPVLGNVLWTDLVENRLQANYAKLLDGGTYTKDGETHSFSGLKAAIAEYTYARYCMGKNIQDTPFGMVVKESDYSSPASAKQLAEVAAAHRLAGQHYLEEAIAFIKATIADYPKYESCQSKTTAKGAIHFTPVSKY